MAKRPFLFHVRSGVLHHEDFARGAEVRGEAKLRQLSCEQAFKGENTLVEREANREGMEEMSRLYWDEASGCICEQTRLRT